MRGRPSLWARTRRLEAAVAERDVRAEAGRLAAESGIGAEELLAEAECLAARCQAAGATSLPAMAPVAAAGSGLDPGEIVAAAERWREGR